MDFFYYLIMCKCLSTTVCGNGTIQFTFFFIIRLNVTIITSYDLLIVILLTYFFFIIKLLNGLKKDERIVARIKHGFVELVMIIFTLSITLIFIHGLRHTSEQCYFGQNVAL